MSRSETPTRSEDGGPAAVLCARGRPRARRRRLGLGRGGAARSLRRGRARSAAPQPARRLDGRPDRGAVDCRRGPAGAARQRRSRVCTRRVDARRRPRRPQRHVRRLRHRDRRRARARRASPSRPGRARRRVRAPHGRRGRAAVQLRQPRLPRALRRLARDRAGGRLRELSRGGRRGTRRQRAGACARSPVPARSSASRSPTCSSSSARTAWSSGGGVVEAGDLLLGPLRAEVERRARVAPLDRIELVSAQLGAEAGAIGAALWGAAA